MSIIKRLLSSPSRYYRLVWIFATTLQVQTLGLTFLLRAQHTLARGPEIGHLDSHPALTQRHHARLGADGLDVGAGEVVLLRDELLELHVLGQAHLARVQEEDLALGVLVGVLEEDLAVDTTRPDEGGVQRVDLVGGHDDLDVTSVVEAVQLVKQLQHGPLHLALAARRRVVPFCADGVNLVDEDNRGGVLAGDLCI